jgi:5-formyltetrahydrofolate cyclo-ligase
LECASSLQGEAVLRVGVYAPFRHEVNTWPVYPCVVEHTALANIQLYAPRMEANHALSWHHWNPTEEAFWETTPFGLQQPAQKYRVRGCPTLDMILLPCQMLDASGIRLGYGGGYYDRQFQQWEAEKRLPQQRIGLLYQECCIPELPRNTHDVALTHRITEQGLRLLGKTDIKTL